MTDRDWQEGMSTAAMIRWVEANAPSRKKTLADCAQCRGLGVLLDSHLDEAVQAVEQVADGLRVPADLAALEEWLAAAADAARRRFHAMDRHLEMVDESPPAYIATLARTGVDLRSVGDEHLSARVARLEASAASAAVQAVWIALVAARREKHALNDLSVIRVEIAERQAEASAVAELAKRFGRHPEQRGQWADAMTLLDGVSGRRIAEARVESHSAFIRSLHDLFGNPFRPVAFDLRWRTADAVGLARAIYEERAFERMPILADALMDAGCADEAVIAHCREAGPHYRGCWVVDAVLEMARDAVAIRS